MDGSVSDMLNGILSNPDALNKIINLMPAVAQMMNGSGSSNLNLNNNQEKIIETLTPNPNLNIPPENLMANAEVMTALKNLIAAISRVPSETAPSATVIPVNNIINNTEDKIEKTLDTLKNFSSVTSPESDNRLKLLLALKPFLKDSRKNKIDSAIKYMNAAKIITMFGKNGFV